MLVKTIIGVAVVLITAIVVFGVLLFRFIKYDKKHSGSGYYNEQGDV